MFNEHPQVRIDTAHAELVRALVVANKPTSVLELGLGGGTATEAILKGLEFNEQDHTFTLVDNWLDWGGQCPANVKEHFGCRVQIVTSDERGFVFSTANRYDFIMSDADHDRTHEWFEYVYENVLADTGILIYHDVNVFTDEYPGLRGIYTQCQNLGLRHHLFNRSTRSFERCERGLLVIFK